MDTKVRLFFVIIGAVHSSGVSLRRQLEHIANTKQQSQGFPVDPSRRYFYNYDPRETSNIIGAPSMPSHLPEAESLLPGHTLIKPALGMLKSSVKFPHRDLEDGSGVYGNYENIGIKYDSKNERVLYSGFRRKLTNGFMKMSMKNVKPSQDSKPELRSDNKITLYSKDNEEFFNKKRRNGEIYLKQIYVSKLPTHSKKFGSKWKKQSYPLLLRSDNENEIKNTDLKDYYGLDEEKLWDINNQDDKFDLSWNSKNSFNHIEIDQNAPEYVEFFHLMNQGNGRQWWFFNEVDLHRPLQTK